ncbi:HEAT repeat domain-containing protein [Zhaonella formicivorans]|jgi:HEAT repeat protein|uniref:HEAT repeat domain-containing protein n=1 Tax=Zhaonella formicivorans TaxID=2528593 RepID=UPI0010E8A2B1|nr:HEAT repeat domain-containing protein [Zhaonella formicivorans]
MDLKEVLTRIQLKQSAAEYIQLLDALTAFPGEEAARAAGAFLRHPDYLVRSKAFAVLNRIPHLALLPDLITVLREEKDEEFRLRALEVVQKLGEREAISELIPFLHDRDPLVVRGTIVALGGIGGEEAAESILHFAASPQGRIVRREVVQEALAFCLQKVPEPERFLERLGERDKGIKRYLRGLQPEVPAQPRFTVYPAADYFSVQAKAREIDYKLYKRLIG